MAWITPKTDWAVTVIGDDDMNRIEGNIEYLRDEDVTFNGIKTFNDQIIGKGAIDAARGTSGNAILRVGYERTANGLAYINLTGDTTYSNGLQIMRLNSANGKSQLNHRGTGIFEVQLKEQGSFKIQESTSNVYASFTNSAITLEKDTTFNGSILPTTTPTESSVQTTTTIGNIEYLPRGIYSYVIPSIVKTSGVIGVLGVIICSLEKKYKDGWEVLSTVDRSQSVASGEDVYDVGVNSTTLLLSKEAISDGSNYRIVTSVTGDSTGLTGYGKLYYQKH